MKIKLTQPGYETLTGFFGVIEFVDGKSVNDVTKREAEYLASLVSVETEDGVNPSVAQQIIDSYGDMMPTEAVISATSVKSALAGKTYTAEELAIVADAGGIKAVREIADTLDVKGQSIAELIGRILHKAGPASAVVEPVITDVVITEPTADVHAAMTDVAANAEQVNANVVTEPTLAAEAVENKPVVTAKAGKAAK